MSQMWTPPWMLSCISQTDHRSRGDSPESHGRVTRHTWEPPGSLRGASPAAAGPRKTSQAYGQRAEGSLHVFGPPEATQGKAERLKALTGKVEIGKAESKN